MNNEIVKEVPKTPGNKKNVWRKLKEFFRRKAEDANKKALKEEIMKEVKENALKEKEITKEVKDEKIKENKDAEEEYEIKSTKILLKMLAGGIIIAFIALKVIETKYESEINRILEDHPRCNMIKIEKVFNQRPIDLTKRQLEEGDKVYYVSDLPKPEEVGMPYPSSVPLQSVEVGKIFRKEGKWGVELITPSEKRWFSEGDIVNLGGGRVMMICNKGDKGIWIASSTKVETIKKKENNEGNH